MQAFPKYSYNDAFEYFKGTYLTVIPKDIFNIIQSLYEYGEKTFKYFYELKDYLKTMRKYNITQFVSQIFYLNTHSTNVIYVYIYLVKFRNFIYMNTSYLSTHKYPFAIRSTKNGRIKILIGFPNIFNGQRREYIDYITIQPSKNDC